MVEQKDQGRLQLVKGGQGRSGRELVDTVEAWLVIVAGISALIVIALGVWLWPAA